MPDLTTRSFVQCSSCEEWNQYYDGFVVSYGRCYDPEAMTQYDYSCTCPGYKSGTCEHIKRAVEGEDRCAWNEEMTPMETPADKRCPRCEGHLVFGMVAE